MTDEALIALGSNLGDRRQNLERAVQAIGQRVGKVLSRSRWIETEPIGAADKPFLNGALVCATELAPEEALAVLLEIEREAGRIRTVHWGNRTLDLDIILWRRDGTSLTLNTETLTLPHPSMLERGFVLFPASEVAADWIHPRTGRTIASHASELASKSSVVAGKDPIIP